MATTEKDKDHRTDSGSLGDQSSKEVTDKTSSGPGSLKESTNLKDNHYGDEASKSTAATSESPAAALREAQDRYIRAQEALTAAGERGHGQEQSVETSAETSASAFSRLQELVETARKKSEEVMLTSRKMVEEIGHGRGPREEGDRSNVERSKLKEGDVKPEGETRRKAEGVASDGAKEEMAETTHLHAEGARQKAGEATGAAEQSLGDMKAGARGQVEEAKEAGASWFESVKEKASDTADAAKQKARETAEFGKQRASETTEFVKEKASATTKYLKHQAGEAKDWAADVAESMKQRADETREEFERRVEEARKKAAETAGSIKRNAGETTDEYERRVEEVKRRAAEASGETEEEFERRVKETRRRGEEGTEFLKQRRREGMSLGDSNRRMEESFTPARDHDHKEGAKNSSTGDAAASLLAHHGEEQGKGSSVGEDLEVHCGKFS